jgi:hypothetical protein
LKPAHIPPAAKLSPDLSHYTDRCESKLLMECDRRVVRKGDASDGAMNIFALQELKECSVERCPDSLTPGCRIEIDRGLDRWIVGSALAKAVAVRPPQRAAVLLGHENSVAARRGELCEPGSSPFRGVGLELKCDRGLTDVVVVDFGKPWEVLLLRGPNDKRPQFLLPTRCLDYGLEAYREGTFLAARAPLRGPSMTGTLLPDTGKETRRTLYIALVLGEDAL